MAYMLNSIINLILGSKPITLEWIVIIDSTKKSLHMVKMYRQLADWLKELSFESRVDKFSTSQMMMSHTLVLNLSVPS